MRLGLELGIFEFERMAQLLAPVSADQEPNHHSDEHACQADEQAERDRVCQWHDVALIGVAPKRPRALLDVG